MTETRSRAQLPERQVFTYAEAASYIGLPSGGALRTLVYRRRGPPVVSYGSRDVRFRRVDLDAWLEAKAASRCPAVVEAEPRKRGRPTKLETIARRRLAA